MDETSRAFLDELLHSAGPSGYERPIQDVVREFATSFAEDVSTDVHGNVMASARSDGSPRVMLAGHCDQIGLLVRNVDDQGFVWVSAIGGWDVQTLLGQHLQVWTKAGPVLLWPRPCPRPRALPCLQ